MTRFSRLLREPLVHFLILGALLFAYFEFAGRDSGPDSRRIVVSGAQIEHLAASFARTWQRPPTIEELKGLVDDYVREEIAVREAMAMGLDRDDTIIRRRLRQKLEFITQDVIDSKPPTTEQLESWYQEHLVDYTREAAVAFEQVFIDRDRRGRDADVYAAELLESLREQPDVDPHELGDATMLPPSMPLAGRSEVARTFGEEFATQLMGSESGRWIGPVSSGFGLHLVRITDTEAARPLGFESAAPLVERDFLADRRSREMDAFYDRLLENYRVELDFDAAEGPDAVASSSPDEPKNR